MSKPSAPAPKAAAIYCRISRDQAGEGLGVARQEELCRALAADKGWTVAGGAVYIDNDLSAYSGRIRPAYKQMLADLEAGVIDAVLVVDQDRLTRQPRELEDFIILADRLAVPIANVGGEIDFSTSDGRFRARIMGAVARAEGEKKSERIRRQQDQHARLGRQHGGIRRYGYRHARDREGHATMIVVEVEAERIREAATRFLDGESLRRIAMSWNAAGYPTVSGAKWRITTLTSMLSGPHLIAQRVHRGDVIGDGDWPSILDRATWERVQARLGDPRRARAGRPATHLLTGLLKCSHCEETMYHSRRTDSGAGRYVCIRVAGRRGCGKTAISAAPVERIVVAAVVERLAIPELFAAIATPGVEIDVLTRQMSDTENDLETLARHFYVEKIISRRMFMSAKELLERKLVDLRSQIPTVAGRTSRTGLPTTGEDLKQLIAEATLPEARIIIGSVVDKIVIKPGKPGVGTVSPDRLEIAWRD